ncbi:unnamed protein product [Rotaria socialis]|uniref:Uncharacterized protein n=2 Tax=Rotaria socialis TaxID=392032 RepID=A0A818QNZ7_9BILA|nr:unnamed protein product [Rotaria socialis]
MYPELNSSTKEQPQTNQYRGFMYTYKRPSNNRVSPIFESRLNPSTNITLDSSLLRDLIDFHKKDSRKRLFYLALFFGILLGLPGLILLLTSFVKPKCNNYIDYCSNLRLALLAIGASLLGATVLIICIAVCLLRDEIRKKFDDLDDSTSLGQTSV